MIIPVSGLILSVVASSYAAPFLQARNVLALDEQAFEEAQQRDNTATRAFSSVQIKVYYYHIWYLASDRNLLLHRHRTDNVFLLTCYLETSAQTWIQSKLGHVMAALVRPGTSLLRESIMTLRELCSLLILWFVSKPLLGIVGSYLAIDSSLHEFWSSPRCWKPGHYV